MANNFRWFSAHINSAVDIRLVGLSAARSRAAGKEELTSSGNGCMSTLVHCGFYTQLPVL